MCSELVDVGLSCSEDDAAAALPVLGVRSAVRGVDGLAGNSRETGLRTVRLTAEGERERERELMSANKICRSGHLVAEATSAL